MARNGGDFNLAEAGIKRGLRVSRDVQPRGHQVCQLVSMAIDGVIFGGIERLTSTIRGSRLNNATASYHC